MKKAFKLILPIIATSMLFSGCSNITFSDLKTTTVEDKKLDPQLSKAIETTKSLDNFTQSGVINMEFSGLTQGSSTDKNIRLEFDIVSKDNGSNFYKKTVENKSLTSELYVNDNSLLLKPIKNDKFVDMSTTPKFTEMIGDIYTLSDQPYNLLADKLLSKLSERSLDFKDSTINADGRNINVKTLEETVPSKDVHDNLISVAKSFLGYQYKTEKDLQSAIKGIKLSDVKTNVYINKEDVIHAMDISFDMTIDNKTTVKFRSSTHLTGYNNSKIKLPSIDKQDIISFEQYTKKK